MLQENRNKINEIIDSEAVSLPVREMALWEIAEKY